VSEQTYNIVDKKLPRCRKDKNQVIKAVNKDFYKVYKKKHPETYIKDPSKVREVLKCVHQEFQEIIANDRDGVNLLELMSLVTVQTEIHDELKEDKSKLIDYRLSEKLNTRVRYLNLDTDGKICKIFCSFRNKECRFMFKDAWGFRPCRDLKQKVSKSFKQNYRKFMDYRALKKLYE
jgi:hypothetical protein